MQYLMILIVEQISVLFLLHVSARFVLRTLCIVSNSGNVVLMWKKSKFPKFGKYVSAKCLVDLKGVRDRSITGISEPRRQIGVTFLQILFSFLALLFQQLCSYHCKSKSLPAKIVMKKELVQDLLHSFPSQIISVISGIKMSPMKSKWRETHSKFHKEKA